MESEAFEEAYFEDPDLVGGLKGGDEVRGYGYYPDYFPIVAAQLATLVELGGGTQLLDLGCGKGALAAYARRHLEVEAVGADHSRHGTRHAVLEFGGRMTVRADCRRPPFATDGFDLVWCNGVLQYLEGAGARQALAEIGRMTRRAAFVSNIAAGQRQTEWGKRDELTRLYLRPRQWATLANAAMASAGVRGKRALELPFEGESAILIYAEGALSRLFPLRFVETALARMLRLGALPRSPPGLEGWKRAHP